jgi:hypothetical protein
MPVGRWMEIIGMDAKVPGSRRDVMTPPIATMTTRPVRQQNLTYLRDSGDLDWSPSPSPQPEREKKVVKKEEKDGILWEPWLEMSKGHFKPLKVRF